MGKREERDDSGGKGSRDFEVTEEYEVEIQPDSGEEITWSSSGPGVFLSAGIEEGDIVVDNEGYTYFVTVSHAFASFPLGDERCKHLGYKQERAKPLRRREKLVGRIKGRNE